MTVGDIMTTGVMTIRESDSLEQARYQMETADVRHLPVVNAAGRLVGILSAHDVFRSRGVPAVVSELMTHNVRTVTPATPAHEAVRLMLDQKIGGLPVIADGKLVAMVTATDFLAIAYRALRPLENKVANTRRMP